MTWLPAIVLFGSSAFPIAYYLSSPNRNQVGRTGAISVAFPVLGLVIGVVLMLGALGSLVANPMRLGVSLLGVVEVLVVLGFLVPRVIGASAAEFVMNSVFG